MLATTSSYSQLTRTSDRPATTTLAELVHANHAAIVLAWKKRVATLPKVAEASPIGEASSVLDALTRSLEARDDVAQTSNDLPRDHSFSAPRAIAELAYLTESIEHVLGASFDSAHRSALHAFVDGAIGRSLARDSDHANRLRTRLRLATDVTLVGSW